MEESFEPIYEITVYIYIYIVNMCLLINSDSNIYQVNKDNDSSIPNQIYSCVKRWGLHPKTGQQLLMGKGMINQWMESGQIITTSLRPSPGNHG